MKIILDEARKEGVLVKDDGTEFSRYTYKNLIKDGFTLEDLKNDVAEFNVTLGQQEEFKNIKELARVNNIHSW